MASRILWAMLMLSTAGPLLAADVWVGTWKLNVSKSTFAKGREVKEMTSTVIEQGGEGVVVNKGTSGDGKPISQKWSVSLEGGTLKFIEGGPPPGVVGVAKRIDANTIVFTTTMNGKQVATTRIVLSADGKSFTETFSGVDPMGQALKAVLVFDRQ